MVTAIDSAPSPAGKPGASRLRVASIDVSLLSERVYAALREDIFRQVLRPGQRLDVREIAAACDVSAAPVRQALARLGEEGLVEIAPRRGTFVTRIGPDGIREIFQIRRLIETGVVDVVRATLPSAVEEGLASLLDQMEALAEGDSFRDYASFIQLDAEFHRAPLTALANQRLLRLYDSLHAHIHVARGLYSRPGKRAAATLAEHRAIWHGFQRHSIESTKEAILSHLANAEADLVGQIVDEPVTAPIAGSTVRGDDRRSAGPPGLVPD